LKYVEWHSSDPYDSGMPDTAAWDQASKQKLRPGLKYPLKQSEVELALVEAGAHVHILSWSLTGRLPDNRLPLLIVHVGGDARPGYFGPPSRGYVDLTIRSVPIDRVEAAHAVLANSVLADACQWISRVPARGNAWSASDHDLTFTLVDGRTVREES
jgi:hypothetical protein